MSETTKTFRYRDGPVPLSRKIRIIGGAILLILLMVPIDRDVTEVVRFRNGAEGGTRTPTSCLTRPSNVRVCQFRHFGLGFKIPWSALTCQRFLLSCFQKRRTGAALQTQTNSLRHITSMRLATQPRLLAPPVMRLALSSLPVKPAALAWLSLPARCFAKPNENLSLRVMTASVRSA